MRRRRVSSRARLARARKVRRRAMILGILLLLAGAAMAQPLRERILEAGRAGISAAQAFAQGTAEETELTLPEIQIWALQLGVFDSGESAAQEQARLMNEGIPCAVWQREQMRLICAVARTREGLDPAAAGGLESFVITETAPQVSLRLSAAQGEAQEAAALLQLPDTLLDGLLSGEEMDALLSQTETAAKHALSAHPENTLYTQLAQSLVNWCALIGQTRETQTEESAKIYAQVTMYMLCRELRVTLMGQG